MPAETPQPVNHHDATQAIIETDDAGNFTAPYLRDGDYFVCSFAVREEGVEVELPDRVSFLNPETGDSELLPCLRVTVAGGQAVTGIEIVIRYPPLPFGVADGVPLSPPAEGLPATGSTGGGGNETAGYVIANVAALGALAVAGGVPRRVLRPRERG